jgi:uncharacterized membrane protein
VSSERRGLLMSGSITVVLYAAAMVAAVVGADLAFFRNHFWERLMANIGIVLLFAAFYFRFHGGPWLPWR